MKTYSEQELKKAFEVVEDPTDWRNPIHKRVKRGKYDLRLITEAIIHYTGTVPTITPVGRTQYLITADGYRMGPCGP